MPLTNPPNSYLECACLIASNSPNWTVTLVSSERGHDRKAQCTNTPSLTLSNTFPILGFAFVMSSSLNAPPSNGHTHTHTHRSLERPIGLPASDSNLA